MSEELTALAEALAKIDDRASPEAAGFLTQDAGNSHLADRLTEGGAVDEVTGGRPRRSSIALR